MYNTHPIIFEVGDRVCIVPQGAFPINQVDEDLIAVVVARNLYDNSFTCKFLTDFREEEKNVTT